MTDFKASKMLAAMSKAWGVSYFPDAPENQNPDFQAGYKIGLLGGAKSIADDSHPITVEWKRRGEPEAEGDSFKMWKRGYWAGKFISVERGDGEQAYDTFRRLLKA